jgi:DNA-binding MarR family transcriptional regulator
MKIDWARASKFSRPEQSAGFLLWQVAHAWQRRAAEALSGAGLTYMQFVLLACLGWLARDREDVTQIQLAEFCKIDPMMVSQVIRLMEKKRLVARREHPTDTRAKRLSITKKGAQILTRALPIVEDAADAFFAPASTGLTSSLRLVHEARPRASRAPH